MHICNPITKRQAEVLETIALRYGKSSPEVQQAKLIFNQHGESFFPFILEGGATE